MKKSKTRIYLNKIISSNLMVYIKDKQHHFLKNVLRIKIGDKINIFNGISGEWSSSVISINRNNILLRVDQNIKSVIKTYDIWLIFVPIKQYRMNLAIQKATELGVSKIIPCVSEYANIRSINIKNLLDNAIEAAEQSERLDIPVIEKKTNLDNLFSEWPKDRTLIFCDENLSSHTSIIDTLNKIKNNNTKWAVLVGPEGGFSELERKQISSNKNTISVSLGDRVLRSDTAISVSLFCISQLLAK